MAPSMVDLPLSTAMCERMSEMETGHRLRLVLCSHLEVKFASWICKLAQVADCLVISCNPASARKDAEALLDRLGIPRMTLPAGGVVTQDICSEVKKYKPHVVFDDGGSLISALMSDDDKHENLKGCVEFTTTGIDLLRQGSPRSSPIVDVARSFIKYQIGNFYGTAESSLATVALLTNASMAGSTIGVVGYGQVGRGIALSARRMGAQLHVSERNPFRAAIAHFDGMILMDTDALARSSDIVFACTGRDGVLNEQFFSNIIKPLYVANSGCFRSEIDFSSLTGPAEVRRGVHEYSTRSGYTVRMLANGELVNLAAGAGWPVAIMDLSFALVTRAIQWLVAESLPPGIHSVPDEHEAEVLRAMVSHVISRRHRQ